MGMDIDGKKPVSETGKHFCNDTWWWHPLADYVRQIAPEIASRCKIRRSSAKKDEPNANAKDSKVLATILQAEIDSGRTAQSAIVHQEWQEAMPDVHCCKCDGTGICNPVPPEFGAGDPNNGGIKCNICEGTGKERPWETRYHFSVENVQNFVNFLRDSGGFEPREWCCDCCGRPQSELTPFVEGVFFGKTHRQIAPYNSVIEGIYKEFFKDCATDDDYQKSKERLVQKYGEIKAERIVVWIEVYGLISSSYECSDCISMNAYEYRERYLDSEDPPERCDCCGRHLGALSPFTEVDPVMDYFNWKVLARRYRPDAPPTEEVNKMVVEFFGNCITYEDHKKAQDKFIQSYGEEESFELWTFAFYLDDLFKRSWECRECIVLDTHQYFAKKMAQQPDSGHDSPGGAQAYL